MEEISWMQRIFKVATPSWFQENNIQKELNLHNLATSTSENLFYAGSFVLLVIYPVISYGSSIWKNAMSLAFLVPSRYVVVIGALSTTFSYEMWNIFWMQIAFFLALAILFEFARHAARLRNWADSGLFTAAFFTLFFVQIIDLSFGSAMIRHWDDTEFKELIIAIGLCYYAFEIGFKIRLTRPVKLNTNRGG